MPKTLLTCIVTCLALFSMPAAFAGDDWKIYAALSAKKGVIEDVLRANSESRISQILVLRGKTADSFEVKAYLYDYASVSVTLKKVTLGNVEKKVSEAIEVLLTELSERELLKERVIDMLDTALPSVDPSYGLENSTGIKVGGGPLYVSAWIQVPGIESEQPYRKHEATRWLRTTIGIDAGSQHSPLRDGKSMAIARVMTSVWEGGHSAADNYEGHTFLIKLGTLNTAARVGGDGGSALRVDLDLVGVGVMQTLGNLTWDFKPFLAATLAIGLRLFDENIGILRLKTKTDLRAGVLIADKVFVSARYGLENDFAQNSRSSLGMDAGMKLGRGFMLHGGIERNGRVSYDDGRRTPYDSMTVIPRGWTVSGGFLVTY